MFMCHRFSGINPSESLKELTLNFAFEFGLPASLYALFKKNTFLIIFPKQIFST